MAWTETKWECGHEGHIQLMGKTSGREAKVAYEAGRKCMACWLVAEWKKTGDSRGKRKDAFDLACKIAEGKNIRIGY